MRLCLLTDDHEFLTWAPLVLELKGLRQVNATLDVALACPDPPRLILGQLAAPAFLSYLERREHDRALSRVPLIVFTDKADPPDQEYANELGASYLIETEHATQAEITGQLTHVLRSGESARPLPLEPFAHQRLDLRTYSLATQLADLPKLDAYCREPGNSLPTPFVAFSAAQPSEVLGLFESEIDAARHMPSHIVDLASPPESALLRLAPNRRLRSGADLSVFMRQSQESTTTR